VETPSRQDQAWSGPGASAFWVSEDVEIVRARGLAEQGRFREAEALLGADRLDNEVETNRACTEGIEILRRIRWDYSLDAESLRERLRPTLPDVTESDLERWRRAGQVQHRVIDGRVCYFRREPANLWRFCDEARKTRDTRGPDPESAQRAQARARLLDHLRDVVTTAERTGRAEVLPVRHTVRFSLCVAPDRPGARVGDVVRCWLPFPQVYGRQYDVVLHGTQPGTHVIAPCAVDDERPAGAWQRSIYLEQRISDLSAPLRFAAEYSFIHAAYHPALNEEEAVADPARRHEAFLAERPPHVVFTDELKRIVDGLVGRESNPLRKARRFFEWIHAHIRYCAEQEYATIPSLTRWALERRRGDCGVQVMLFLSMCRYAGIPARWQSGWVTFPGLVNMHDWAEIYVEPWGWLPVDVSYSLKSSDDPRVRSFYFGHMDAYRMIVNLDYGLALHPAKRWLRSEPADFQRGEVEIATRNLYFDEWDWDFDCRIEPADT